MKLEIDLTPFPVPDFVTVPIPPRPRQEGFQHPKQLNLKELDDKTLEAMCCEFRREVFRKSGRPAPPSPKEELCKWLDEQLIMPSNIGDIRRSLFLPWDSEWNAIVRDETAARERPSRNRPEPTGTSVGAPEEKPEETFWEKNRDEIEACYLRTCQLIRFHEGMKVADLSAKLHSDFSQEIVAAMLQNLGTMKPPEKPEWKCCEKASCDYALLQVSSSYDLVCPVCFSRYGKAATEPGGVKSAPAAGDWQRHLMDVPEEDGEDIFTPMPAKCASFRCDNAKLEARNGFWVCPVCGGSYGEV